MADVTDSAPTRGESESTVRRGMKMFWGDDMVPLADTGIMSPMSFDPEDQRALSADGPRNPLTASGIADSLVFKDDEAGVSLVRAWLGPHYVLPRHTHSGDCLYYVIEGSISMGARELRAGDGFFVPSDAPYAYEAGPEGAVVIEFRSCTSFDIRFPGGQLDRWRRLASAADEHGEEWAAMRAEGAR